MNVFEEIKYNLWQISSIKKGNWNWNSKQSLELHLTYKSQFQLKINFLQNISNWKNIIWKSFFQNDINDLKNTWKGIKRIISLKDSTSKVPSTSTEANISLTNSKYIADAFNNYFSNVATGITSSIK